MLERYGVHDTLFVPEEALPRLKGVFRDVKVIGKSVVDGEEMTAVLCTYGSSSYDAGQMSRLLEGLLNEAVEAADKGGRDEDLIEN